MALDYARLEDMSDEDEDIFSEEIDMSTFTFNEVSHAMVYEQYI